MLKRGRALLKRWDVRHPRLCLCAAYTALFALLMGIWVGIFAANGRSFIWYGDTLKQHYPALVYYGRWLRGAARCLLHGQAIPTWDMNIGYGADVVTTLSYYVLGDPLNLLAALVPSSRTELLLEALIVLRGWLAGLAFTAYSLHHRHSRFGTLLGALAYVFCGWFLQTALTEPIFLVPMYCFPLMLLGADYLFEGRRPTLYIAAVALTALSNFLFFYMAALLLAGYAVAKYFHLYGLHRLRTLPPLAGKFLGCSLVGISISAVTLVPTALALFSGARMNVERTTTRYPFAHLWQVLANLTTTAQYDAYSTYCGVTAAAVLGVLVLFACRGRDTILKAAWLVCLALMCLPAAGRLLNGFSYAQNRWVWAFILLESFILARVAPRLTTLSTAERLRLFALLAGYLVLALWYREARSEWAVLGCLLLALLACFAVQAGSARPRLTRAVLLVGCCLGIVLNIGYTYGVDESEALAEYYAPGGAWEVSVQANPAGMLKHLEDDSLWRYDTALDVKTNTAMLMQLPGVSYFFSLNNGYLSQWMGEMGYCAPTDYDYTGLQNRSLLQTLVGVKYFLNTTGSNGALPAGYDGEPTLAMEVSGLSVGAYANEAALPIGFTADAVLSRAGYDALSPVQRQDVLLSAVLVEEGEDTGLPLAELGSRVVIPAVAVTLNGAEEVAPGTYYAPQDGATITLTVDEPMPDAENYLVVQGMTYTASNPYEALPAEELTAMDAYDRSRLKKQYAHFWYKESVYLRLISDIGEGRIDYAMPNNQYYCGRHDFAYNFGCSEQGMTTLTIVLPFAGTYHFDRLDIEYQPVDDTAERAALLAEESLQNAVLGTNSLSGDITVDTDKLLVVQLPYSTGWSAAVDGQPAELLRADTAFLGLMLTPGAHHIELTYRTPGLRAGACLSLAGLAAFLLLTLRGKKRNSAKNTVQNAPKQL